MVFASTKSACSPLVGLGGGSTACGGSNSSGDDSTTGGDTGSSGSPSSSAGTSSSTCRLREVLELRRTRNLRGRRRHGRGRGGLERRTRRRWHAGRNCGRFRRWRHTWGRSLHRHTHDRGRLHRAGRRGHRRARWLRRLLFRNDDLRLHQRQIQLLQHDGLRRCRRRAQRPRRSRRARWCPRRSWRRAERGRGRRLRQRSHSSVRPLHGGEADVWGAGRAQPQASTTIVPRRGVRGAAPQKFQAEARRARTAEASRSSTGNV